LIGLICALLRARPVERSGTKLLLAHRPLTPAELRLRVQPNCPLGEGGGGWRGGRGDGARGAHGDEPKTQVTPPETKGRGGSQKEKKPENYFSKKPRKPGEYTDAGV
jgi:hypothetical protein